MSRNKRILQNSAFLFLNAFFTNIVALVAMAFVARTLGVKDFGIFTLAFMLSNFLCEVATLGVPGVMIREAACYEEEERNAFLGKAIPIRLTLVAGMVLFLFIIAPYTNYDPRIVSAIHIALVGCLFQAISNVVFDAFQAIEKLGKIAIREVIVRIFTAILACTFLWAGWGLFAVCWVYVAGSFLGMVYMLIIFKQQFVIKNYTLNWKFSVKILKESLGFALTGASGLLLTKTDILMISQMMGSSSLGIYNAAIALFDKFKVISETVGASMYPAVAKMHKQKEELNTLVGNALVFMLIISVPLALGTVFVSGDIILFILGNDYAQSATIFSLFALGLPFSFLSLILQYVLMSLKKQNLVCIATASAAFLNVFLNYIFILNLGIEGAAIATLIVRLLIFILLSLIARKTLLLSIGVRRIFNIVPASLLLLGFLYMSENLHFTVRIIIGGVLYLGSVIPFERNFYNFCLKLFKKNAPTHS